LEIASYTLQEGCPNNTHLSATVALKKVKIPRFKPDEAMDSFQNYQVVHLQIMLYLSIPTIDHLSPTRQSLSSESRQGKQFFADFFSFCKFPAAFRYPLIRVLATFGNYYDCTRGFLENQQELVSFFIERF
jgi:hypothetical protein